MECAVHVCERTRVSQMALSELEMISQWLEFRDSADPFWAPFECAQGGLLKSRTHTNQVYETRPIPQLKNRHRRRDSQGAPTLLETQQNPVTLISLQVLTRIRPQRLRSSGQAQWQFPLWS
jgi:hypothetical protein